MKMLNLLLHRRATKRPLVWLLVGVAAVTILLTNHHLLGSQDVAAASDTQPGHPAAEAESSHHPARTHARVSPNLTEIEGLTAKVLIIVLQLALILAAAKLLGW